MTKRLTKTALKVLDRMKHEVARGTWERVPSNYGFVIRHDRTRTTPDSVLCTPEEHARNGFGRWPEPEYRSMVFLTMVMYGSMLIRTAPAPWVGASDSTCPYWLADAVLDDPDGAHEPGRLTDLRLSRKRTP